jgi:osmoprotectant transport system permease protein
MKGLQQLTWWLAALASLLAPAPALAAASAPRPVVRVGSKAFTEGVILGEMLCHLVAAGGGLPRHYAWLGDTSKVWNGLLDGSIDAYCEYTGTLFKEVLEHEQLSSLDDLRASLARRGIRMSRPLGFNNNYALAMREERAEALGITSISDLKKHPELKFGFSNQFVDRGDGWQGLRRHYGLPQSNPAGLDHSLVYQALDNGTLDVTDIYSTDAQIVPHRLKVLKDDRNFFPAYQAVILYRADLEGRAPQVVRSLLRLEGRIDDRQMTAVNARVEVDDVNEIQASADFLNANLGLAVVPVVPTLADRLLARTGEHLLLVGVSLALAVVAAVPLGVLAARFRWLGQAILGVVGVVQTVPALALLFLLSVAMHRLGVVPALTALFFYSLLPIVRNTYTGLRDVPLPVRESAEALGLSSWARLRLVELPLAAPAILAGVKTAAVINIGNATLGGLIAAGGYGLPIIVGLNKSSLALILEGTVPAVALALLAQGLFEVVERLLVSRGLRLRPAE